MIRGKVSNPSAVIKYINTLKTDSLKEIRLAVVKSTLDIHRESIKIISKNEGGTQAVRRGKNVTVSDPFEPPHTDTGKLRQSIKFDMATNGESGRVGSNLKYAAWLEFGTEKMAPRPWLSVAVDNLKDEISKTFVEFVEKAFKK
jgi:HK97 gp10 family phage protein